jgi:hypothetical protein
MTRPDSDQHCAAEAAGVPASSEASQSDDDPRFGPHNAVDSAADTPCAAAATQVPSGSSRGWGPRSLGEPWQKQESALTTQLLRTIATVPGSTKERLHLLELSWCVSPLHPSRALLGTLWATEMDEMR